MLGDLRRNKGWVKALLSGHAVVATFLLTRSPRGLCAVVGFEYDTDLIYIELRGDSVYLKMTLLPNGPVIDRKFHLI
jgi:hypothetical protein